MIAACQFESVPPLMSGGIGAQVYNDVKNRTLRAADGLRFLMRRKLIMQSAEAGFSRRVPHIDLDGAEIQTKSPEFLRTPGAGEESAVIVVAFEVDQISTFHIGFRESHRDVLAGFRTGWLNADQAEHRVVLSVESLPQRRHALGNLFLDGWTIGLHRRETLN